MTVISNDETASEPNQGFPLMGYLGPRWVSPWEYCKLLRSYGVSCGLWSAAMTEQEKLQEAVEKDPVAFANPKELHALYNASKYLIASGIITTTDGSTELGAVIHSPIL